MTANEATKSVIQPPKETARPPRDTPAIIYAKPLPVNIYPLPPLIPHNPLSILHIAFAYVYQLLVPPTSHPNPLYKACWSPETRSVHVTDETAIRAFWESGFFGKGSLSRSEPSWLDREKRKKGLLVNETSEEVTKQRREDRKKFKKERARKEREIIEEKLEEERRSKENCGTATPTARAKYEGVNDGPAQSLADSIEALVLQEPPVPPMPAPIVLSRSATPAPEQMSNGHAGPSYHDAEATELTISNQEHLQLAASEAFFLSYALGVLQIHDPSTSRPLSTSHLLTLFRTTSYSPPLPPSHLRPDDPFLLSYTTYHHFRSLGWVVRPGIKFGVEWLLYLRGPVFSHAEFAVIVLPAYRHEYWRSTEEVRRDTQKREKKTWWWVHCVNRVQTQVRKNMVIAYVEVPPPSALVGLVRKEDGKGEGEGEEVVDIRNLLGLYKVRELTLKRWISNRERD